jgi:UDP-N-acetylglucosamine 2-epimerase (non-hydrolysing)
LLLSLTFFVVVFGTRPEVIKLAPVITTLRQYPAFHIVTCYTGQHKELVALALRDFAGVEVDIDLAVMTPNQQLTQTAARMLQGLETVLPAVQPQLVVVQGDTLTAYCGSVAAFFHQVKCAHVEAGLRTGDLLNPFPEGNLSDFCSFPFFFSFY